MTSTVNHGPAAIAERLSAASNRAWVDVRQLDPATCFAYARLHRYPEYEGEIAPPGLGAAVTMSAVLAVLHDDELDIPFDRNVHAAQNLEWLEPLRLRSTLTTEARVDRVRVRERAVFFDVVTSTANEDGQECLRGRATQAVRHV